MTCHVAPNGFNFHGLSQISQKAYNADHLAPAERLEAIEDSVQEMGTKLDQLLDIMAGKKQEKMGVLTELAGDESNDDV